MKSRICGGLCLVTFLITAIAGVAFQGTVVETENPTSITSLSEFAWQGGTQAQSKEKATKMVAVTSSECPPCRRLKLYTIPVLLAEGYDVTAINFSDWNGPAVYSVPTLFYMDEEGNIIRRELGFKTPAQVKKYLTK